MDSSMPTMQTNWQEEKINERLQELLKREHEMIKKELDLKRLELTWQKNLLERERNINEKELELKKCEQEFDQIIKIESERIALEKHCPCCRLNLSMQPDTMYAEWAVFKTISGVESRIGISSVGVVYLSDSFYNVYHNWLQTEIGQHHKNSKLKSVFITKLELSWSAADWRMIDNFNSKLIVCELNRRFRIKYLIE
jgi:hypothetical protein